MIDATRKVKRAPREDNWSWGGEVQASIPRVGNVRGQSLKVSRRYVSAREKKGWTSEGLKLGLPGSMGKCGALRKGKEMLEHKIPVGGPSGNQAGEVGWTQAGITCPLYPRIWEPLTNFKCGSDMTDPVSISPE